MKVYIYEYKTCSPSRAHHTNMFKDGFAWCRTAGIKQMTTNLNLTSILNALKQQSKVQNFHDFKTGLSV